jgi:hypothetical protein
MPRESATPSARSTPTTRCHHLAGRALCHAGGPVVRRGDPVGKNDGRVVAIAEGAIVVREQRRVDYTGRRTPVDVAIKLPAAKAPAFTDDDNDDDGSS